jgi:hypothetical protein
VITLAELFSEHGPVNQTLIDFELFVGLSPPKACLMLGIAYVTYAHYRSGHRVLPGYHRRHILNLRKMTRKQIDEIVREVGCG